MDLGFTPAEREFRTGVRELFASPTMRMALEGVGSDRDPRPVYSVLGERGLLAANWPPELGGSGRSLVEAGSVLEELTAHEVPELLYVISVLTVGNLLHRVASARQQRQLLPAMARGERYACVMFTEPEAGSDLAAVATQGRFRDGDLVLRGRKAYGATTRFADHGLCLVRTEEGRTHYSGLTLVLVPLRSPGVVIERVPSVGPEDFYTVTLDDVTVTADAIVGAPGQAWPILEQTLALERCGLDYYAKAAHWYRRARRLARRAGVASRVDVRVDLAQMESRLRAAGLMAYRQLVLLDRGEPDTTGAAAAKWYASELAADIAAWMTGRLGAPGQDSPYWEGPGLRISGGTAEMQLETIASAVLEGSSEALGST